MQNLGVTGFRVSHRVGMEGPPELGGGRVSRRREATGQSGHFPGC